MECSEAMVSVSASVVVLVLLVQGWWRWGEGEARGDNSFLRAREEEEGDKGHTEGAGGGARMWGLRLDMEEGGGGGEPTQGTGFGALGRHTDTHGACTHTHTRPYSDTLDEERGRRGLWDYSARSGNRHT